MNFQFNVSNSNLIEIPAAKLVEQFKRSVLDTLLHQCTAEQREFFRCIHTGEIPEKSLVSCIDLCQRTIIKNKKLNRV